MRGKYDKGQGTDLLVFVVIVIIVPQWYMHFMETFQCGTSTVQHCRELEILDSSGQNLQFSTVLDSAGQYCTDRTLSVEKTRVC